MAMSQEQKKAASDRMKAMHAAKKKEKESLPEESTTEALGDLSTEPVTPAEGTTTQPKNEDLAALNARLEQLAETNALLMAKLLGNEQPQGAQIGRQGLIGTVEKYSSDPNSYPDPCERLAQEQKLRRYAFLENYELSFAIEGVRYQTIDNIWQSEPRFTLELHRVIFDEETGEVTNGRYIVCRLMFHEDPETAVVVARQNGLSVDEGNQKAFLDEMRYIRMRDWLLEAFLKPKPAQPRQNKRDMVIGGKQVQYFEINSENPETIPFSQLNNKL